MEDRPLGAPASGMGFYFEVPYKMQLAKVKLSDLPLRFMTKAGFRGTSEKRNLLQNRNLIIFGPSLFCFSLWFLSEQTALDLAVELMSRS